MREKGSNEGNAARSRPTKGELLAVSTAALKMELAHALDKRDTLAAGVTTLTAQIAKLEARLSACR
jgi:outer membrane murein-binding lipoprotein Lpp